MSEYKAQGDVVYKDGQFFLSFDSAAEANAAATSLNASEKTTQS